MDTGHKTVDSIGRLHISGTVIPFPWFQHLTFKNGKPYTPAIFILADIVYWYRPTIERDEATGVVKCVKKKFASDMLQRNYQAFADQFGLTKRQAKEACDYLVKLGLVKREFREIVANGKVNNNVAFFEPVPKKVEEITFTLPQSNVPPSYVETYHPPTIERRTNTKINTEINTNTEKEEETRANPYDFYQQNFGMMSPYMMHRIGDWLDDHTFEESAEIIVLAMQVALENGAKNYSYVDAILKDWHSLGVTTKKQAEGAILEFKAKRGGVKRGIHPKTTPRISEVQPESSETLERRKRLMEQRKNESDYTE